MRPHAKTLHTNKCASDRAQLTCIKRTENLCREAAQETLRKRTSADGLHREPAARETKRVFSVCKLSAQSLLCVFSANLVSRSFSVQIIRAGDLVISLAEFAVCSCFVQAICARSTLVFLYPVQFLYLRMFSCHFSCSIYLAQFLCAT